MEPILEVKGLSIAFQQYDAGTRQRRLPVIRDLSLTVGAGQVVAVVGSSGSGKSLLAHGILGILPYNAAMEGEIRYDGELLTPERVEALRGREIVLVPQGVTYLDPLMKVGPQIRRGKRSPEARAKSRSVLERYGLGAETEELYPFELSGGMARRVLVFYAGETVEEADAADFAAGRLRHPYTRALWRALPQNGFMPIPGAQPYPGEIAGGCLFAPRCPHCHPACRAAVPYREADGGRVRCLYPEEGGTP